MSNKQGYPQYVGLALTIAYAILMVIIVRSTAALIVALFMVGLSVIGVLFGGSSRNNPPYNHTPRDDQTEDQQEEQR